jgi:hypothetical protein
MRADVLDLALLFHRDSEQVDRDRLLVGEAQVGLRRVALGRRPAPFLPKIAHLKVECY